MVSNTPLEIALQFARLDISVIPSGAPGHDGKLKAPAVAWKSYQNTRPTIEQIQQWENEKHPTLWGMITGPVSGLFGIDIDDPATLPVMGDLKPHTFTKRGLHFYFKYPADFDLITKAGILPHVDIRAFGGFMNFAGENRDAHYQNVILPTKEALYSFEVLPDAIKTAGIIKNTPAPAAMPSTTPLGANAGIADRILAKYIGMAGNGNRSQNGIDLACQLRDNGLSETERLPFMLQYAATVRNAGDHPYDDSEAIASNKEASKRPPRAPWTSTQRPPDHIDTATGATIPTHPLDRDSLTDTGNAERLFREYGENIRFISELNRFALWSGEFWKLDNPQNTETIQLCMQTVKIIAHETTPGMIEKDVMDLLAWEKSSLSTSKLTAMATLVRSIPGITVSINDFDKDMMLFNVQNGVINLYNGKFQSHNRADMMLQSAPIIYDKSATCPLWDDSIDDITGGNKELAKYLQKIAGYCLTGLTKEQIFFYFYGVGRNGKSTFVNTLCGIMGDYAAQPDNDLFMKKQFGATGHNESLANIQGKRLVATTEVESGKGLDTGLVKRITGGENIKTSRKHEHEIEFTPHCKIIISGNHKADVGDDTLSVWRRVKLTPFTVVIPADKVNPDLFDDLKTEWPGILNWALAGTLDYRVDGLGDIDAVKEATGEYRSEQDVIAQFIIDKCDLYPTNRISRPDLWSAFDLWNQGAKVSRADFYRRIRDYGEPGTIGESRTNNERFFTGICKVGERQTTL